MKERDLYPRVARWAEMRLGCFRTALDRGLRLGRIDVVGLRDRGGRLSGRSEVISIEVKRGTQPFATSVGQASGYSIYADRCYLAEYRAVPFSEDEEAIAAHLGVGLLRISGESRIRVTEVITAPPNQPLEGLRLELIEKLDYSQCALCGSLFRRGSGSTWDGVIRVKNSPGAVSRAAAEGRGLAYWLYEQSDRAEPKADYIYHRRYLCSGCVWAIAPVDS